MGFGTFRFIRVWYLLGWLRDEPAAASGARMTHRWLVKTHSGWRVRQKGGGGGGKAASSGDIMYGMQIGWRLTRFD